MNYYALNVDIISNCALQKQVQVNEMILLDDIDILLKLKEIPWEPRFFIGLYSALNK